MKERVHVLPEFWDQGNYFFTDYTHLDEKMVRKKWKPELREAFNHLEALIQTIDDFNAENIQHHVKYFITEKELSFGAILPILRLSLTGTTKGPDVFATMVLLGKPEVTRRISNSYLHFDKITG